MNWGSVKRTPFYYLNKTKQKKEMKKFLFVSVLLTLLFTIPSCVGNKSEGDLVGVITNLHDEGLFVKTTEFHLQTTQSSYNTGYTYFLSIDDWETLEKKEYLMKKLKLAQDSGYIVKVSYSLKWPNPSTAFRGRFRYHVKEVTMLHYLNKRN